jgi:hypothetical protein
MNDFPVKTEGFVLYNALAATHGLLYVAMWPGGGYRRRREDG